MLQGSKNCHTLQVFMRGGNYIASDMLLRTSEQRYRDEVRLHAEVLHISSYETICDMYERYACICKARAEEGAPCIL